MEDGTNERFVSHATAWEMAIKHALGKLRLEPGFDVIFPGVVQANGFQMLLPEFAHYRELLTLHELVAHRMFQLLVGAHRGRTYSM